MLTYRRNKEFDDDPVHGIRQNYVDAGQGARRAASRLRPDQLLLAPPDLRPPRSYSLIAPDLRGYGETDKPATGYDKRTMAKDLPASLDELDIGRIALIGHDCGVRVSTRLTKDYRERVGRLVGMDNVRNRRRRARDLRPCRASRSLRHGRHDQSTW